MLQSIPDLLRRFRVFLAHLHFQPCPGVIRRSPCLSGRRSASYFAAEGLSYTVERNGSIEIEQSALLQACDRRKHICGVEVLVTSTGVDVEHSVLGGQTRTRAW